MPPTSSVPPGPKRFRPPIALLIGGLVVVACGFVLPRLMTGTDVGLHSSSTIPSGSESPGALPEIATADGASLGWALARMALGIVVVGGLCIVLTRWLTKRTLPQATTMHVLASLAIDARSVVHLVRAGDRRLLVGKDFSGIKALVELPGKPAITL